MPDLILILTYPKFCPKMLRRNSVQRMHNVSDGMASVNTIERKPKNSQKTAKKSDIGNKSELSIKTCSVNEA